MTHFAHTGTDYTITSIRMRSHFTLSSKDSNGMAPVLKT